MLMLWGIFIMIIAYLHTVSLEQVHHHPIILPFPFPHPPFQIVLGRFHYAVFICTYVEYFHLLNLSAISFPFPSLSHWHPQTDLRIHSFWFIIIITIIIILGLCSADVWGYVTSGLSRLVYITQHDDLQFHHFPVNNLISFFLFHT
jgi:hypothetical protein